MEGQCPKKLGHASYRARARNDYLLGSALAFTASIDYL